MEVLVTGRRTIWWVWAGAAFLLLVAASCAPRERGQGATETPPAVVPGSAPSSSPPAEPFVVQIDLDVIDAGGPVIRGVTNLPDGMMLAAMIHKPYEPDAEARLAVGLPACKPDCIPWETDGEVSGGVILMRPKGRGETMGVPILGPGRYGVTIGSRGEQSREVKAVTGGNGELMQGPAVSNLGSESTPIWVVSFSDEIAIPAEPPPPEVAALLSTEAEFNEACRGGVGDAAAVDRACARRDELVRQLEARGWCIGEGATSGVNSYWAKCVRRTGARERRP